MRKYFFIAIIFLFCSCFFIACDNSDIAGKYDNSLVQIGETKFDSLAEAINHSEDGDTILIFNDIEENSNSVELETYTKSELDNKLYVAYEINKPLTIKGVSNNGGLPKVYGSFLITLSDEKYKDSFVTIENLEIIHDYVSETDANQNEKFTAGVRVIEGSSNIVDNYIHMSKEIGDDIIENYDLPLYYGIMLSRPKESKLADESFDYDISDNKFGDYKNKKDLSYSSAFMIVENVDDVGDFAPNKLNTASYNFSLAIYNKNYKDNNSIIYACDYDGKADQYKSLITNNYDVVDFNKLSSKDCRFIFLEDFLSEQVVEVDVYGIMVFTKNVENVVFNIRDKDAKVIIIGDKIGVTKINEYNG